MRDKCEAHGVTDCLACQFAKPKRIVSDPDKAKDRIVAPPNIEGLSTPEPVDTEDIEKWTPVATISGITFPTSTSNPTPQFHEVCFDALPTDDSRASKVMRAAAAYAKATMEYAKYVAIVERIKSDLLREEAKLTMASAGKATAEEELKKLVNGEIA